METETVAFMQVADDAEAGRVLNHGTTGAAPLSPPDACGVVGRLSLLTHCLGQLSEQLGGGIESLAAACELGSDGDAGRAKVPRRHHSGGAPTVNSDVARSTVDRALE